MTVRRPTPIRTAARAMLKVPEKDVRKAIRDWLDAKRIPHIPVEARHPLRVKDGHVFFRHEQARDKGIADFIAFPTQEEGMEVFVRPVAIEAKRYPDGVQSADQIHWETWWRSLGFDYIVARSADDVQRGWPINMTGREWGG